GYTKNEVIGGNWFEIFIPEKDQSKVPGVFLEVLKGMDEYSSYENPILCKDGSEKMIGWKNSLIYDQDNHISGMLCVGIDVTEQRKAENELKKNEMKLKEAQRLSSVGSWELDLITNKLTWSDEIYNIFNIDPLEFGATYEAFIDSIHPDDRESVNDAYNLSLKNKTSYEIEHRLLLKDGTIKFVKEFCETFFDDNDKPISSFGIIHDITKRKKYEEEIITLKNKYLDLYNNSPDMYVSVSAETGKIIECNTTLLAKTGYDQDEIIGKMILEMYHEDSLEKAKGVFEEFKAGNKITNKNLALKKKDGEKIHVNLNVEPIKDETGKVIHSISSWRDIGELVAYDNALMESEEKYKALYENAPLSYQSLNEDGTFRDINPTWLKTLGYNRDEVIGKNFGDFLHPDWKPHFEKNFPEFKRQGYVSDVQFKIRHKDGHYLDISFEGCIGYYPDGSFKQTYCVFKDITEQKKLEYELKKHHEHLEELVNERTKELEDKNNDLERLNKLFVNRESRIKELRDELKKYEK
ncbi:MAG: PAS domain S-box protein, partial [Candidatus Delongbacteria bacterium]|nr:PAS domain S-box protein [Candidatus Delongbacteria bacterium]